VVFTFKQGLARPFDKRAISDPICCKALAIVISANRFQGADFSRIDLLLEFFSVAALRHQALMYSSLSTSLFVLLG